MLYKDKIAASTEIHTEDKLYIYIYIYIYINNWTKAQRG